MMRTEWLVCIDPDEMLRALGCEENWVSKSQLTDRQLRLFACACCREVWSLLREPEQDLVGALESLADGLIHWPDVVSVRLRAFRLWEERPLAEPAYGSAAAATSAAADAYSEFGVVRSARLAASAAARRRAGLLGLGAAAEKCRQGDLEAASRLERAHQCDLLRDLVGDRGRPLTIEAPWLTWKDATVLKLAEAIYDDRAYDRLPILADALEDAGCPSAELLAHLRGPGPHARGCHALDALLGKR
jgi:hypothetical protein